VSPRWASWAGDSKEHLKKSFDDMARDLARFLVRLSRGGLPEKVEGEPTGC